MTAVLAVVVSSVLLLWLLLVLVVVVAVVVVVVVGRRMFSLRGDSRFALQGCMQAIDPASWLRYIQFYNDPPHPTVAAPLIVSTHADHPWS